MADTKKLRSIWRKIKCRLTGGHRYDPGEIRSRRFPERGVTCFIHRCVKCDEYQVYAVEDRALYKDIPQPEKVEVDNDGLENHRQR